MLSKGNVDKTKDLVVELEGTKYEIEAVRAGYGLIQLKPLVAPIKVVEPVAPKKKVVKAPKKTK